MNFLRISIVRKFFIIFIVFGLLIAGAFFYFYYTPNKTVPFEAFLIALGVFLITFILLSFWIFVRPFKIVLSQMEALIAGKPYKQIYTGRIDEIGVLAHFFNQVTKGFREVSHDIKDRERMIDELTIAAQLQHDILPLKCPNVPGLQIIAKNKPATELGGDIFNFITTSKGKTYIYIGDVTGHGVAGGLIMTMATSLISVFADIYDSAYDVLVNVNHYLKRHVKKAMFLTMVMLSWDSKNEKLTYVGAGHEHIIVYRADSGECEAILSGGVALGMVPDNSKLIKEQEIIFNDGDFALLYSDGITEARNLSGEFYGLERLKNAIVEYAPQYSAEGVNYHIAQDVSTFLEGHGQDDDMSLITIKRDKNLKDGVEVKDQTITW